MRCAELRFRRSRATVDSEVIGSRIVSRSRRLTQIRQGPHPRTMWIVERLATPPRQRSTRTIWATSSGHRLAGKHPQRWGDAADRLPAADLPAGPHHQHMPRYWHRHSRQHLRKPGDPHRPTSAAPAVNPVTGQQPRPIPAALLGHHPKLTVATATLTPRSTPCGGHATCNPAVNCSASASCFTERRMAVREPPRPTRLDRGTPGCRHPAVA
jgi:hypothetical protein